MSLNAIKNLGSVQEGTSSSNDDSLLDGGSGGTDGVLDSVLDLTDLDFGGSSDLDDSDSSLQLGKSLLELFLIVLAGGGGQSLLDLLDSLFDGVLFSISVHDDGVVLGDDDVLALSQDGWLALLESEADVLGDDGSSGEDGNIVEDSLSVVSEGWGLDGADLESSSEFVEDQGGEGFTFDVLSNDEEGSVLLHGVLQEVEDALEVGDLLFGDQDVWVFELGLLGLHVGGEVGGDVSSIESHSLDEFDLVLEGLSVLDGDGSVFSDLFHELGDELSDGSVSIGGDGGNVFDLLLGLDLDTSGLEVLDDFLDGEGDSSSEVHGVHSGGDGLASFLEDGSGKDGGSGGTITSLIVGFAGDLFDEGSSQIFHLVGEFNSLSNGDSVLGDLGGSESLFDDNISSLGSQSNLDSISQLLTSSQHLVSAFNRETEILSSEKEDAWVNKLSESSSVNGSLGDL